MKQTRKPSGQKTKKKKSGLFSTILLIVIILAGLSLLLYPSISNYWNSLHASNAISNYVAAVAQMDSDQYSRVLQDARAYNMKIASSPAALVVNDDVDEKAYNRQLNVLGTGIMGYIEIKKISCFLPIYHGTSSLVLQIAVGHIPSSSLPVGGKTTHCVLSGHRGLPSAKLFSDLDKMEIGDTFIIQTLNETMTYEVDQIRVVLPNQLDELHLVEGRDYCTLVTCTPYGINTHRLLVRGHRTGNEEQALEIRVVGDALRIRPTLVAPALSAPMLLVLFIVLLVNSSRAERRRRLLRKEGRADGAQKPNS